jgi:hypothetical protein
MSDINMGMSGTTLAVDTQDMITITSSGITSGIGSMGSMYTTATNTINLRSTASELLDKREMNLIVVDHKVSEMEMLKLKEVQPDYADLIKENIAKKAAKEVTNKMSFTKKKLPDEDTHHFYGRVYVFTKEELIQLIEEARNA